MPPKSRSRPQSGSGLPHSKAHRPPPPSPRRSRRPLLLLLLVATAALALFGARRLAQHPASDLTSSAAPAWDRPENATEATLLRAALAQPADAAAQQALGQQYQAENRPFEALWAFQRARDAVVDPPAVNGAAAPDPTPLLLAQASALEAAGLRARALSLLEETAPGRPGAPALAERRAELLLRLGRPGEAVQTVRRQALTPPPAVRVPGSPENYREGGASQPAPSADSRSPGIPRERGASRPVPRADSPSSCSFWERGLGGEGLLLLGRALEAAGDDPGALAAYRRAAAAEPQSEAAALRLGRLLVRLGQVAEGRAALETARRLAPADPEPCYALGMSFMPDARAHPEGAIRWLMAATRLSPHYGPAERALGQIALLHRLWKLAVHHYGLALTVNPRDPEALVRLGEALDGLGHPAEAHERRGVGYLLQGKLPQALAEFRAEKAADPGNKAASIFISQTLTEMGLNGEAAVEIRETLARHPDDADLKERLVTLYILSHTGEPARRFCEDWSRVDPGAAKPLWLLGRIALPSARRLPEAIDDFEQAARRAPRDPEIQFALGEALSRPGARHDSARALELLGRAVELAPDEARYHYQLGLFLQQLDRSEPARRQLHRALDVDPTMTAAYTGLIQVSGKLREPGQIALLAPVVRDQQADKRVGAELRHRAFRSPRDPAAYAALARYLADRGDLKEARAQWEVVAGLNPRDPTARREIARLDRVLSVL